MGNWITIGKGWHKYHLRLGCKTWEFEVSKQWRRLLIKTPILGWCIIYVSFQKMSLLEIWPGINCSLIYIYLGPFKIVLGNY